MLVKESGVEMLKEMLRCWWWSLFDDVPRLARQIITRCERFAVDNDYVSDDERDTDNDYVSDDERDTHTMDE